MEKNVKKLLIGFVAVAAVFSIGTFVGASLLRRTQEAPKPGAEHAVFKHFEGTWDAAVTMMGQKSKGTQTDVVGCGGLYLITDFKGDMGGMPFHGHGIVGWDAAKKSYVTVWVDGMTSKIEIVDSKWDEKAKTMTTMREGPGPDGQPTKTKEVHTVVDADRHTFVMTSPGPEGKDMEILKIEYTRKK